MAAYVPIRTQPPYSPHGDMPGGGEGYINPNFQSPSMLGIGEGPPPAGFSVISSPSSPGSVSPSAPSMDDVHKIEGYEKTVFKREIIAPPPLPQWRDEPPARNEIAALPSLTDEEVEEAVSKYVSEHCCYGKGVAKTMTINEIRMSNAFHYTLETFCERRESAWKFVPFKGQVIDGPMNGRAPGPWEVPVQPTGYFLDGKMQVEVPHTAFIKPCHECVGNGRVRCHSCVGMGQSRCTFCEGTGRRDTGPCTWCHSSGHRRCTNCEGTGQIKCKTCSGFCQLKGFVQLTVTWKNHYDDYISDSSDLPEAEVRKVTGDVVFGEENPMVWPLTNSGDIHITQASKNLVERHKDQFMNERILRQRHCLRVVPIAKVNYTWKSKNDVFYVYGFENKVYFEKYPQRCCWSCTIM